jgi:hypothetical protein
LTALVIVGVAWLEELAMARQHGQAYQRCREGTAFLLPLPSWLVKGLSFPVRLVSGAKVPDSGGQVLAAVALYLMITVLLSRPFLAFQWPPRGGWWAFPYNVYPFS